MRGLMACVAEIEAMKPTAIKAEWERVHGQEPPPIASSLLASALAFDAQCAAQRQGRGKDAPATKRGRGGRASPPRPPWRRAHSWCANGRGLASSG